MNSNLELVKNAMTRVVDEDTPESLANAIDLIAKNEYEFIIAATLTIEGIKSGAIKLRFAHEEKDFAKADLDGLMSFLVLSAAALKMTLRGYKEALNEIQAMKEAVNESVRSPN